MVAVLRYGLRFFTQIEIMNRNKIKNQTGRYLVEDLSWRENKMSKPQRFRPTLSRWFALANPRLPQFFKWAANALVCPSFSYASQTKMSKPPAYGGFRPTLATNNSGA